VLAEVIRRVSGMEIRDFLAREIAAPLGLEPFDYGIAANEIDRVAQNAFTGPPILPPISTLLRRALGVDFKDGVRLSNDERFLTAVVPAGNVITTANHASRFMQLLLNGGELDGVEIFEPRTVFRSVAEQTYYELDLTLGVPLRYAMGFMLGGEHLSLYGRRTARAFGHLGFTNVVMYADPERDISACLMTSGKPFIAPGVARWLLLLQGIARRCPRDWGR
jgi:CubicO group peptidase (beta-lactamase class C family)